MFVRPFVWLTAAAAGVSVRTVYKWLRRFRLEGLAGLADRSSKPHRSPTQLQLEKADIVIELRRTKRMTAAKIAAVLHLARSTVARLLQRRGIGRLRLFEPKPEPGLYEWPRPGDMLQPGAIPSRAAGPRLCYPTCATTTASGRTPDVARSRR